MPTFSQVGRQISLSTPLGEDVLLLTGFKARESISQLFHLELDLLAELDAEAPFEGILGQPVTVSMRIANGEMRHFHGIVSRFTEGARDETFVSFRAEISPKLWLLTRRFQSRVFQHIPVPEILRQALAGLDVVYQLGTYQPRDFCVQYRESDFQFVSRLMEEEGIYYYFQHRDGGHQMVVTDATTDNAMVAGQSAMTYEGAFGGTIPEMRIASWEKTQELRSGEYTLWDHCFELPGKHLEARVETIPSVQVGHVTHMLAVGGNDKLEVYDFPGGYAQRFDGVDRAGLPAPQNVAHIFDDSVRTVRIRMEQEEAAGIEIRGTSDCGNFTPGNKFTLERHYDADGLYLLTSVEHAAKMGGYRSGEAVAFAYENRFTCVPDGLRYRPQRVTPRPVIAGVQTATVVGPAGEEIFCDKYGRIKVQFHWDRQGKKNADSSCWVRVSQVWAGKGWGAFFWPRIGHEVVVAFEEGDPDQPIIVGSVYNAENMPPFELPLRNRLAGVKSATFHGNPSQNFNGLMFFDEKGHEHLALHSERSMTFYSEFDKRFEAGRHKGEKIPGASITSVGRLPGGD